MILTENVNKVESTFGQGQRLTIAATPVAMKILSKGLYSRPLEAVLREYACNAADAHTMVGCGNKPFEVYLPTYQNMTLKFKDFGPGIPPDKVVDIYSTYFSSTKTFDNTQIGALGLGSKSALAISDQFIVEISHGGFLYTWSIYKDESGYPCIPDGKPSVIEPTVEPTGVTVTIPVSDIRNFEETAKKLFQYFSVIPTVWKGSTKVEITPPKVKEKYTSCWFEEGKSCFALMGNILYPIDSSIAGLEGYGELGQYNKVIIPFNIGDIEFSASRESLEFNRRVVQTLKSKFKNICDEFGVELQKSIDLEKNPFEALIHFNKVQIPHKIKSELRKTITFKGVLLNSYYKGDAYTNYDVDIMKDKTPSPYNPITFSSNSSVFYRIDSSKRKYRLENNAEVESSTKFYYNDEGKTKGIVSKLAYLWNNTSGQKFYLFGENVDIDKWLTLNHLTKADLIPTSTVPKLATQSNYEARKRAGVFEIKGGTIQKEFWKSLDEVPDFAYYIVKSGDKMIIGGKEIFPQRWNQILGLDVIPTDAPIYGVSKSFVKNYEDWENMEDLLPKALEARRAELELALANKGSEILNLANFWPEGDFKKTLVQISKNCEKMYTWEELYGMFNIPLVYKKELKINVDEILREYPMLAQLVDYYKKPTKEQVQSYIQQIDEAKALKEEENV